MALKKLEADLSIIAKLGTNPGVDDGLGEKQLKAKFDEAANIIKDYLNNYLILEIEKTVDVESLLSDILDVTLSKSDKAANAKATGNAIRGMRAFFEKVIHGGDYVLESDGSFSQELSAAATIRVMGGEGVMHGNLFSLNVGGYEDVELEAGTYGLSRNDLVVIRCTKDDTGTLSYKLIALTGANTSGDPVDPEYITGDINGEDHTHDFPIYRIKFDGYDITAIEPLFKVEQTISENIPKAKAGFIYPLAASVVPEGFLLCDGAAYSRVEYPELFAAIGTMYGSGDGSTTFNVPDITFSYGVGAIIATGKGTGVSVADIIMGAQALPLGLEYGGLDATNPFDARKNLEVAQAIESIEHFGCYYRIVDGETEWLNPPMMPGVEYRTTERWNGKAVYIKRVQYKNSSEISGNALHYIPHGITSYDKTYGVKVTVAIESYLLPYFGSNLDQSTAVTGYSATNIELRTTGSSKWSAGRTWNFDVSFVKPQ